MPLTDHLYDEGVKSQIEAVTRVTAESPAALLENTPSGECLLDVRYRSPKNPSVSYTDESHTGMNRSLIPL